MTFFPELRIRSPDLVEIPPFRKLLFKTIQNGIVVLIISRLSRLLVSGFLFSGSDNEYAEAIRRDIALMESILFPYGVLFLNFYSIPGCGERGLR